MGYSRTVRARTTRVEEDDCSAQADRGRHLLPQLHWLLHQPRSRTCIFSCASYPWGPIFSLPPPETTVHHFMARDHLAQALFLPLSLRTLQKSGKLKLSDCCAMVKKSKEPIGHMSFWRCLWRPIWPARARSEEVHVRDAGIRP